MTDPSAYAWNLYSTWNMAQDELCYGVSRAWDVPVRTCLRYSQHNSSTLLLSIDHLVYLHLLCLPSNQGPLDLRWPTWVAPPIPWRGGAVVSCMGGQDQHVVGNLGHLCGHWKTLKKLCRGTNKVMSRDYIINGALSSSLKIMWKVKEFVSVYMLATLHSTITRAC